MTASTSHQILLLHGLARKALSMRSLERFLSNQGFHVLNIDYPSRQHPIEALGQIVAEQVEAQFHPETPTSLVSHSMGGLVGQSTMTALTGYQWHSAVLIAPPSQGSKVAQTLGSHPITGPIFRSFYGPAGEQFLAEEAKLPPLPCPFGIIAGTKHIALANPTSWVSNLGPLAETSSDGTLAVSETQHPDMHDFAEMKANHTTIMHDPRVHQQVLHFLRHSQFQEESAGSLPPRR